MKKLKPIFLSLSFILPFIIYLLTLAPDVQYTDSGELAGVCSTLGIAHPTGYPLFTILGHLWTYLPLPGSQIFALNIFAAFVTAVSGLVFFLLSGNLIKYISGKDDDHSIIALASSLAYSFALTIWAQGVSLEVYSLQLLMFNLVLYFLFRGLFEKSANMLFVAALMLGLTFANHMTAILLVPALLFIFFFKPGEKADFSSANIKLLLLLFIPLLIGISLYIYLPLRSASQPEFNWGWVSRGFDKFMYHVQGKQYQIWMFSDSSVWGKNLGKFFSALPMQFGWIGILPLLAGFWQVWKKSKQLFIFLLLLVLTCLFYTMNYSIHDIDAYFSLAIIALLLFMSAGFYFIWQKKKALLPALFVIPLLSAVMNYTENDESGDYLVSEYTNILADNLDENAIIISAQWDFWCSAFWYKQRVEGLRPDVALIEKELLRRTWFLPQLSRWYPEITDKSRQEIEAFTRDLELFEADKPYNPASIQANFVRMLNSFIDKNIETRPVYITMDVLQSEQQVAQNYEKIPQGFAFRLEKKGVYKASCKNINLDKFIASIPEEKSYLDEGITETAAMNLTNIGRYAMFVQDTTTAREAFGMALKVKPDYQLALQSMMMVNKK